MTDELEQGHAAVVASHSFPIEDARARAQASQRFDDQRKAAGEVVARPRIKPHAWTVLAGDDPEIAEHARAVCECRPEVGA
jgi:hypothetical protein